MDYEFPFHLSVEESRLFLGERDQTLRDIEKVFSCAVAYRQDRLIVQGICEEDILRFRRALSCFAELVKEGKALERQDIYRFSEEVTDDFDWQKELWGYTVNGKPVFAKNRHQYDLLKAISDNTLTFAIGSAGTGKTFLAVVMAVKALKAGETDKIILSRPAVEAGENLGFLPGDLREKVDPYLMPLYDSLEILLGHEQVEKYLERGTIEIIPLAYMRGRTFQNAFILLDEAQNTTAKQMLMFLTRLGKKAKMVVTGDTSQIDLSIRKANTGLVLASNRLQNLEDIAVVEFTKEDVVRHPLVEKILENFRIEEL